MSNPTRSTVGRLLILMIPILGACDSGTEPAEVGNVTLAPVHTELEVGNTVQLVATVVNKNGSVLSGHPVTWTTSQPAVASVTSGGIVRAEAPGTATIRATAGGKSTSLGFTILPAACTGTAVTGSIALEQTRTGTLGPTSCTFYGDPAEGWSFNLTATTAFEILMTTSADNAFVVITDPMLYPLLWSEWHPEGARIVGELAAGQYFIWVTSWYSGAAVSYQLSAQAVQVCSAAAATTTLALGETRTDSLGGGGCVYPQHWVSAVGYRFDVPTATSIRLQLASASFDALLLVTDPYMNLLFWDDDGGGGTDARIHRRFAAGEYIVWVTGYWPGSSGPYEVSAAELEIELCPTVGELQPGQSVTGALAVTDCASLGGRYADPWALSLSDQATLRIDLTSSAFDTFLIVEDEYGEVLAWDDDSGGNLNSRLTYTFAAGEYRVVVTSYGYGATGAYQLSSQLVAGMVSAEPAAPAGAPVWRKVSKK
jgi:hypothetical protein